MCPTARVQGRGGDRSEGGACGAGAVEVAMAVAGKFVFLDDGDDPDAAGKQ
jgi:hypothetical protein